MYLLTKLSKLQTELTKHASPNFLRYISYFNITLLHNHLHQQAAKLKMKNVTS